jgi:hypothetical protein
MLKILRDIIEAHGGGNRWNQFSKIDAQIVSGGKYFELKGVSQDSISRKAIIWLQEQKAWIHHFGSPDQKSVFTPGRVTVETLNGNVLAERIGTPNEIHEHMKAPQWDPLDLAYFNGYALWTYLATPFFMLLPGIEVNETEPWQEGDETWKGLSVTFPSLMVTHSAIQNFYFGDDNLIRRHDYHMDTDNFYACQYISDFKEVQGIRVPSKRKAYKKGPDGKPLLDELMVHIDLSDFHLS